MNIPLLVLFMRSFRLDGLGWRNITLWRHGGKCWRWVGYCSRPYLMGSDEWQVAIDPAIYVVCVLGEH